jgi:hypothetical protein
MLTKMQIEQLLKEINTFLSEKRVDGEICLYGGAAMCLVFESRPSTRDVDAIFYPSKILREAISQVAQAHNFPEDWLNDAVKGFVVTHPSRVVMSLSHLRVYAPEPDYLLAMKAMSARVESADKEDVIFLIKKMKLQSPKAVFSIIEKYYPQERIRPATQFFIEEIFEHEKPARSQKRNRKKS